jgi:V8-like Glu-specific endopeptidase
MKSSVTASVLVAACAAGCGSGPPTTELSATSSSAIQNGTTDATHAFALGIVQTSQLQSHQISVCSGALLAPNLVATARHCVSPLATQIVDCSTSSFSGVLPAADLLVTTDTQLASNSAFVAVSQIIVPTGPGQSKVCGNDIALLILQKAIKLSQYVVPAISPPMTDHSAYATSVTTIGYGIDSPTDMNGTTAGVRRIKQGVGLVCIPNDKHFTDCFKDPMAQQVLTAGEFVSGDASTCDGDSGSSAFDQGSFDRGQWVSFGVLSRGGVSADGMTCVQPIYTRFDAWDRLLVDTATKAASLGGYPPPPWVAASSASLNGSGVADGMPCGNSSQCQSTNCIATQADAMTGVCASSCNGGSCATGFTCTSGYCLAEASAPGATSDGAGCSTATLDASGAAPRRPLGVAGLGLAALIIARRRRR